MDKIELAAILKAYRADSIGVDDGELSNERATALDHYHGRPYGNEQEGRSQVVSKDLKDTIDWAMPAIMRLFTASGNIAEFLPVGPEDEPLAEQESDYTNRVIMQDNEGFLTLYDACKDALILKNGYVKHYWEEREKIEDEEYEGLTLDDITKIVTDLQADGAEAEILAQEERQIDLGGVLVPVFDVKLQVKRKEGKCIVEAVPAEEVRVSKRCRGSLQDSPFTEHVTIKTRSDLIEMGMGKDFVYSLASYNSNDTEQNSLSRNQVDDESGDYGTSSDRSMDEIEYCEAYVKVDYDGDGIAELRKVVSVSNQIPEGEEWNEPIPAVPMTGFVAKRMPHRHVGESLDDDLADLQEIKTTLNRQMLDNIYLTNNNQWVVNQRVNLKDFLQSLPGGIKRVNGNDPVSGCVEPIMSKPIVADILPVVSYYDGVREERTGISKATTGLDPDTLRDSTKGAFLENLNRASQKIEMMARMLAEVGVKEMVKQVHSILVRYQDKPRVVKMRGNYVSVNPREWKERNDLVVKVGLGTGNEQEKRDKLLLVAQAQEKMKLSGLVSPVHEYNLFADVSKTLGFDMPSKYAFDPNSPEYMQYMQMMQQQNQQTNPLAEVEQIKGQFAMAKMQFDGQVSQMKEQHKHEMDVLKMRYDQAEARAERASKEAIEAAKLEMQAFLAGLKVDLGPAGFGAMPNSEGV